MTRQFQIELEDTQILVAIDRALAALEQPGEMMAEIGRKLEAKANDRFETKTDPTGAAWAPLSAATKEIYASDWFKGRLENKDYRPGIPGTLLERTRQLRNSLAHNSGVDYVEIGTSRQVGKKRWQVGALHEWGTQTMPRRGILTANPKTGELGASDQSDVLAIVSSMLGSAFGQ